MKKLGLFFALSMLVMVSCKNDSSSTEVADASSPSVPSSTVTNNPVPVDNPLGKTAEPAVPAGPITTIEFEETEYDYGTIMEGEKVIHDYVFVNTGDEPLIIQNAKGSCGCTVPEWERDPIPPGGSSVIKVQFDSKNKGKVGGGLQSKRVTITANTDPVNTYLTIKGKVDKDPSTVVESAEKKS